jgi:predicted metal-binding membrane protein
VATGLTVEDLIRKDRVIVSASAATLVAVSWLFMVNGHVALDAGLEHALHPRASEPGLASFAIAFTMWMVMMVAMMLPPVMPWILLFGATARRSDAAAAPYVSSGIFVSGYFTVWAAYSLVAASAQLLLQRLAVLHGAELRTRPYLAGALLLAAGLYQMTPLKTACLKHCRSPLGFFLSNWRSGPGGAYRMGLGHGLYCVACCWALMALSFGLGVMNLLWMVALTLILCIEKIAPGGQTLSRLFGLALIAWGLSGIFA